MLKCEYEKKYLLSVVITACHFLSFKKLQFYDILFNSSDHNSIQYTIYSLLKLHYFQFTFLETCIYKKQKKSINDSVTSFKDVTESDVTLFQSS